MKTIKTVLWIAIIILLAFALFDYWKKTDAATMSTSYCYQTKTDGSLYHYVCSE